MFSLIKSIFANTQKKEELKILIIGECGSGKTSLFNLISSYDNKSKYDILNTEILRNHDHANCALGFNTKSIIFNKKNLKIYDLEGTATNTINIYDCYYDDSNVIFYVIDSRSEKHIFKTIIYLSHLCNNSIKDKYNSENKNEDFFKPTIILGNKSEDGTSFFSAPCISNYIKTIDIYKNEKFWNFVLSNDNIFLNYYLGILHEKVVDYFLVNNYSFNEFILKEKKDENLYSEIIGKSNSLINNIKNNNKGYITVEEVESNELLSNIMKNIINENISNYKNMPIEVYNISVLKNKGICEVIEIMFEKYFKKEKHNNLSNIYNINYEKDNKIIQNMNEHIPYNENEEKGTKKNMRYNKKYNYDAILNTNDKFNSQNIIYNGNRNNTMNKLVYSYYPSNPINDYISEKNYHFRNNVYKKRINKKKEKYSSIQKNNYIMYMSNTNSVNLFIEHIQHLYFGRDNYENILDNLTFTHNKNVKIKKKLKIFKINKKKNNISECKLNNSEEQNTTNAKKELYKNNYTNERKIKKKKEYSENKILSEKLKEVEEIIQKEIEKKAEENIKSDVEKKVEENIEDEIEKKVEENIEDEVEKKNEENLECEEKKENEEGKGQHKEGKCKVLYEENKEKKGLINKEMKQYIQTKHEKIYVVSEDRENEDKKEKKELNEQINVKERRKKGINDQENHEERKIREKKTNKNVKNKNHKYEIIQESHGYNNDKKCDEFKNNSNYFINENYLKSASNLSSVSLLDSDTILKLAERGEDSCKNVSKKMSQNFFQKKKEKSFILSELQNIYCYENIEQNNKNTEQEVRENAYEEEKGEEEQTEEQEEEEQEEHEEEQQQKGQDQEVEYEEEKEAEKEQSEQLKEQQQKNFKNNNMYKEMREGNYMNNIESTCCSYNKKEAHEKCSSYKEISLNNIKNNKNNYIYKGKINKKRYLFMKKKKKKKLLQNMKLINIEENSSSSLEDVNLMNIMYVDSLHKI
ncbi:conserved Plasmodium protein, unknown function [Plasmodium relictum]|uniref:Uncharacterized protein n=1 Tax=Plasmodium relictum TaxID=85471 RepID=A0A1J1HA75_PLARL|nr:conserved Plasmodium protein, unknown function [Plasmodium relictum]CRH01416.1 conserved Plasmodium protein, unknown function [Plasmodium relictum]